VESSWDYVGASCGASCGWDCETVELGLSEELSEVTTTLWRTFDKRQIKPIDRTHIE
jgi:hypothetical protein